MSISEKNRFMAAHKCGRTGKDSNGPAVTHREGSISLYTTPEGDAALGTPVDMKYNSPVNIRVPCKTFRLTLNTGEHNEMKTQALALRLPWICLVLSVFTFVSVARNGL